MWQISSGRTPFQNFSSTGLDLISQIVNGARESIIRGTPEPYIELYTACWQDNPEKRPQMSLVAEILGTIDIENIKQKITLESNLMKNIENLSSNALNNSNVEVNDINLETNYSYFQVTSTMEKDVSKISQLILSIMGRDKNQILMYCSGDGQKWDGPYSFFDFNLSSISSVATITNFNSPNSPTPDPNSPTPGPNSPTPGPNSPTPGPNSPTPGPNSPTPDPNSPTPDPNSPTPDPNSPTPDPNAQHLVNKNTKVDTFSSNPVINTDKGILTDTNSLTSTSNTNGSVVTTVSTDSLSSASSTRVNVDPNITGSETPTDLPTSSTSTKTYEHEPCTKSDDPRCKPKATDPTVISTTEENEVITEPPKPKKTTTSQSQIGSSPKKSTITQFKTYTTTETLYFPGYTTYTSSTGTNGQLTTYATYIPPSTVVVVKKVTSTTVEEIQETNSSPGHLDLEFSVYNLYNISISFFVIAITIFYLIVA
ncbi:1507_t:CDS:2 [Entrophospora sp. SA101]|nr:1507_t:CDS:2 [Entrophospora sp. SA101]